MDKDFFTKAVLEANKKGLDGIKITGVTFNEKQTACDDDSYTFSYQGIEPDATSGR